MAYSQLGYCYRLVRYHCVAVDYFKKMLELAWYSITFTDIFIGT